jgi:hypothetical protein
MIYIFKNVQMIWHFQKEINVIMYIIEKKFNNFISKKISIRYEFFNFMFL